MPQDEALALAHISQTTPLRAGQESVKQEQTRIRPAIDARSSDEFEKCGLVRIHRLRVSARIGCTESERQHEQTLEIDLELNIPSAYSAGQTADLTKSVCYLDLRNRARDLVQNRSWVLVEELCYALLDLVFTSYVLVEEASVRCRKFVLSDCDWSEVQLSTSAMEFRRENQENSTTGTTRSM